MGADDLVRGRRGHRELIGKSQNLSRSLPAEIMHISVLLFRFLQLCVILGKLHFHFLLLCLPSKAKVRHKSFHGKQGFSSLEDYERHTVSRTFSADSHAPTEQTCIALIHLQYCLKVCLRQCNSAYCLCLVASFVSGKLSAILPVRQIVSQRLGS